MRDCTRGGTVNPMTYLSADGTYSFADPHLSGRYPSPIGKKLTMIATADAYGVGVMGSVSLDTPLAGLELMAGREAIYDPDTGAITQFVIFGKAVRVGPSTAFVKPLKGIAKGRSPLNTSIAPYGLVVQGADNVLADYSGPFEYRSSALAAKLGVAWGGTTSPRSDTGESVSSEFFGPAFGYALTTSAGDGVSIPLYTLNPGQLFPTIHWREAFEVITQLWE